MASRDCEYERVCDEEKDRDNGRDFLVAEGRQWQSMTPTASEAVNEWRVRAQPPGLAQTHSHYNTVAHHQPPRLGLILLPLEFHVTAGKLHVGLAGTRRNIRLFRKSIEIRRKLRKTRGK